MDRAPFLARGDHPDRHAAQPSQPAGNPERPFLYRHPSGTKHQAPIASKQPAHPAQPIIVEPDTQREFLLLPPCQLIRPVVDAPNLEAPCPVTGYSRGSVRRRLLARGLMRWDGVGIVRFLSLSPILCLLL